MGLFHLVRLSIRLSCLPRVKPSLWDCTLVGLVCSLYISTTCIMYILITFVTLLSV